MFLFKMSTNFIPLIFFVSLLPGCRSERITRESPLGEAKEVSEILTGYFIADKECVKKEGRTSFQALVGRKWNGRNLEIKSVPGRSYSASRSLSGGVIADTLINLHQFTNCKGSIQDPRNQNFLGENCSSESQVLTRPVHFPICQDSYLFPRHSYESIAITSAIFIDEANQFYNSIEPTELPKVSLIVLPVLEKRTLLSTGVEDRKFQMDNLAFVDSFIEKPAFVVYPTSPDRQPGENTNAINLWESSWTMGHEFGHLILASVSGVKKSGLGLDSSHMLMAPKKWSLNLASMRDSQNIPVMISQFSAREVSKVPRLGKSFFRESRFQVDDSFIAVFSDGFSSHNPRNRLTSNTSFDNEGLLDRSFGELGGKSADHSAKRKLGPDVFQLQPARVVSNQDIWSAVNEGFADLYATAMSGGSELTNGVPCIAYSRNPDYGFFQTGEAKVIDEGTLGSFFSSQNLTPSPNCAAPFLQSSHTIGAIIAYGIRGLSLNKGDDSAQFGKSLVRWAKGLGDYVRKNPKLEFQDLVFEGVKVFGSVSNEIVYLNQNQCGHLFQVFPDFSKSWYENGKLSCRF